MHIEQARFRVKAGTQTRLGRGKSMASLDLRVREGAMQHPEKGTLLQKKGPASVQARRGFEGQWEGRVLEGKG